MYQPKLSTRFVLVNDGVGGPPVSSSIFGCCHCHENFESELLPSNPTIAIAHNLCLFSLVDNTPTTERIPTQLLASAPQQNLTSGGLGLGAFSGLKQGLP